MDIETAVVVAMLGFGERGDAAGVGWLMGGSVKVDVVVVVVVLDAVGPELCCNLRGWERKVGRLGLL